MARNAQLESKNENSKQEALAVSDDVDKIRDIIFGSYMREYASRFESLEKLVLAKVDQLEKNVNMRLDELAKELSSEKRAREAADSSANDELQEVESSIAKKLKHDEDRWTAEFSELQGTLGEGHKELFSLIEEVRSELDKRVTTESANLEERKLAKEDLAQMFMEVARGLQKDS